MMTRRLCLWRVVIAFVLCGWLHTTLDAAERLPVSSTVLSAVGYDADAKVLEIEFRSGALYRYREVPRAIFDALLSAKSKGRYFNRNIRDKFAAEQITAIKSTDSPR